MVRMRSRDVREVDRVRCVRGWCSHARGARVVVAVVVAARGAGDPKAVDRCGARVGGARLRARARVRWGCAWNDDDGCRRVRVRARAWAASCARGRRVLGDDDDARETLNAQTRARGLTIVCVLTTRVCFVNVQPSVPESVLKKRTRDAQWAEQKAAAAASAKAAGEKKREEIFKRAEKYVKEYRDQVSFLFLIARACVRVQVRERVVTNTLSCDVFDECE
jgi:hypothetical protein